MLRVRRRVELLNAKCVATGGQANPSKSEGRRRVTELGLAEWGAVMSHPALLFDGVNPQDNRGSRIASSIRSSILNPWRKPRSNLRRDWFHLIFVMFGMDQLVILPRWDEQRDGRGDYYGGKPYQEGRAER